VPEIEEKCYTDKNIPGEEILIEEFFS